jgi:hypothetical protein
MKRSRESEGCPRPISKMVEWKLIYQQMPLQGTGMRPLITPLKPRLSIVDHDEPDLKVVGQS